MKKKLLLTLLVPLLFVSTSASASQYLRDPVTPVEKTMSPYNAIYAWSIKKSDDTVFRCTGTFIGNNHFLSAGHCITDRNGYYNGKETGETETNADTHLNKVYFKKKNALQRSPFKVMKGYAGYSDFKNDISLIYHPEKLNIDTSNIKLKIYKNLNNLVGQTVSTVGYSRFHYGDFTQTSGKIIALENDGTLTVEMNVAEQNSGSPVFLNGEIIGVVTATADVPECKGESMCSKTTVTPFTLSTKANLFDPNKIPVNVVE